MSKYYEFGTVFKKEEKNFTYMKLNIGKFKGQFKEIIGITNDGEQVKLSSDTLITLQNPEEKFSRMIKDEGKLAEKLENLKRANIVKLATVVVK